MCRFAANGWPIATSGTEGLGVEVRTLLISAALGNMGTATSAKIAGGLLDTYAALQLVPIYSDSSSSTTSSESDSFGDSSPEATPEATNAFESSSATQSSDFNSPAAASPSPSATAAPLSASQQAVSSAVAAAAVATVNTTVNSTHSVFGQDQEVVFSSSGSYLAPAAAPSGYGIGEAHIEVTGPNAAPAQAPVADGGPVTAAGMAPTSKSRKATF